MGKSTKPVWILCPRCELNYIKKSDQYCNVCKKEMKLIKSSDDDIGDLELCPICKINFVQSDQEICDSCKQELGIVPNEDAEDKEVADWHKYIADDDDEDDDEDSDETAFKDILTLFNRLFLEQMIFIVCITSFLFENCLYRI